VGTGDADDMKIRNSDGSNICAEVEILKYSQVRCTTKEATWSNLALYVDFDDWEVDCTNDDDTLCYFESYKTDFPEI